MRTPGTTSFYNAFGLTIASEIELNELRGCEPMPNPDVVIEWGGVASVADRGTGSDFMDFSDRNAVVMYWPQVGHFEIVGNRRIIIEPHPGVEERLLAFPLLGPILAWVLHAKGFFILHASAVEIDGRTAVFLGDKLAGKSTTAAAFIKAGGALLTDDLVAIRFDDVNRPEIMPAFAQIKLAEDAAASIEISGAMAQPLIHENFPKRQHLLPHMAAHPAPADLFLVLKRGAATVGLTALPLNDAVNALNRFSYLTRFVQVDWSDDENAEHFRNCVRLASVAKVGVLDVPVGLERLPQVVSYVRDMVQRS